MSNPMPPRPPAHPTRRQLDELEALMQRMLALPVAPFEEGPTSGAAEMPAPKPSSSMALSDSGPLNGAPSSSSVAAELDLPDLPPEPEREPVPPPVDQVPNWPVAFHFQERDRDEELPNLETVEATRAITVVSEQKPTFLMPALPPEPDEDPEWALVRQRRRRGPWTRLLIRWNRKFDRWMFRLGSIGRWFRQPQGRALIGWTGVLLLASALAWGVLDWMGWTW